MHGNESPRPLGIVGQAVLIAGKDLEIEWRSRVTFSQVLPFAALLLLLFAVALDPDRGLLPIVAPGLLWLTVLLSALFAIGRAFALERTNRAGLGLVLSGVDPIAMFLGKAGAVAVELFALEGAVALLMIVLYDFDPGSGLIALVGAVLVTIGVATAGCLYGALVASERSRDSLLAILLLPVLFPVLLAGTRVFEAAANNSTESLGWLGLLAVFAALYGGLGALSFGSLLEEV